MYDFAACCGGIPHTHIIQDGCFEQAAVLKNERHLVHQRFFRNVAYIHIPDQYTPFLRVKKSCDEIGKGGLTAAGDPYKGDGLPRLNGQRHIV